MIRLLGNLLNRRENIDTDTKNLERYYLDKLEKYSVEYELNGQSFFVFDNNNNNKLIKVEIIGKYFYHDVDGEVSNILGRTPTGRVLSLMRRVLFKYKPHEWVIYLNESDKALYSVLQSKHYDMANLYERFYVKLPVELQRNYKLEKILK